MPIKVTSVRALPPFKLQLNFSDGMMGTFDAAGLIAERGEEGGQALRERSYFGRVGLENGVPTWPNHFDISPEWLYEELGRRGLLQKPQPARRRF